MTKKKDTAEIEAVERELPLQPPKDIVDSITAVMHGAKLIYSSAYVTDPLTGLKEKACRVTCTACGRSFYLAYSTFYAGCHSSYAPAPFGFVDPADNETKYTGKECICPECGSEAEALHIGNITRGTYFIERTYFMTIHNVRGHFAALGWVLFKECDKAGKIYFDVKRYEGVVMVGGVPVRYCGYGKFMYGTTWRNYWEARQRWHAITDEWDEDEIYFVDPVDNTDAGKSAFEECVHAAKEKIVVSAYMQLWSKYPQIENLVRSGFSAVVSDIIRSSILQSGYSASSRFFSIKESPQYFDAKKARPHDILGVEKPELPALRGLNMKQISFYKRIKAEQRVKLAPDELMSANQIGIDSIENLLDWAKERSIKLPIVRTLHYLKKQKQADKDLIGASYFRDYLSMASALNDTMPEDVIYPRNLKRAHDSAAERYKLKENEIIDKQIAQRAAALTTLCFADDETGLMIRPAASQRELADEGKELHHCVATYTQSVAKGSTAILFIRRIAEPDTPYFTLEYKNGSVSQNRGLRNCNRTAEVSAFEKKWLKHIEEVKHGKRNGDQTKQLAGA